MKNSQRSLFLKQVTCVQYVMCTVAGQYTSAHACVIIKINDKLYLIFMLQAETSMREGVGDGGRGLLQNPSRVRANAVAAVKSDASSSNVLGLPGPPPLQVGGASRPVGPTHSQTILMKHLQNRLTVKRSELARSNEHISISSEKISPSNSQTSDLSKKDVTNQKPRPSRHDRKPLVDVHPTNSLVGSSKGSPLTSSWESFTRPVKLTERQRREEEEEEEGEGAGSGREGNQRLMVDSNSEKAKNNRATKVCCHCSNGGSGK